MIMNKKEIIKIICTICKERRQKLKISQETMAKHCSVSQPAISRFESGRYDDLYLVIIYADLLSIDLLKEIRNI